MDMSDEKQSEEWHITKAIEVIEKIKDICLCFEENTPYIQVGGAGHRSYHPMKDIVDLLNQLKSALFTNYGRSMWNESEKMNNLPALIKKDKDE